MHMMIDIETLGTRPSAPVIQIGARLFRLPTLDRYEPDTVLLGRSWLVNINVLDLLLHKALVDQDTVDWWGKQGPEAIAGLLSPQPVSIVAALRGLKMFVGSIGAEVGDDVGGLEGVWANGDSFDIGLINILHEAVGLELPWAYNSPRDCRTLWVAARELAGWTRPGRQTLHNGDADSTDQALDVIGAWRALQKAGPFTQAAP